MRWSLGYCSACTYMINRSLNESLDDFLNNKVFSTSASYSVSPDKRDVEGFNEFMERYIKGLAIERAAVENLN